MSGLCRYSDQKNMPRPVYAHVIPYHVTVPLERANQRRKSRVDIRQCQPAQLNITRSAQYHPLSSISAQYHPLSTSSISPAQLNITRSAQLNHPLTRSAQLNITRSAQLNITRSAQLNITRLAKHLPQLYQCVPSKRNEGSIVCHCLWEHPMKT